MSDILLTTKDFPANRYRVELERVVDVNTMIVQIAFMDVMKRASVTIADVIPYPILESEDASEGPDRLRQYLANSAGLYIVTRNDRLTSNSYLADVYSADEQGHLTSLKQWIIDNGYA